MLYRDRLSASDMIQVRKVIEHVYEKVMGQGSDAGSQSANNSATDRGDDSEDLAAIAAEKVELVCNDQVGYQFVSLSLAHQVPRLGI